MARDAAARPGTPRSRQAAPARALLGPAGDRRVRLLIGALLLATLTVWTLAGSLHRFGGWQLGWLGLAVLYAGADWLQLNVEVRRQTLSLSLVELPLVLGVVLLPPGWHLLARLVGAAVVFAAQRRRLVKSAFNLLLNSLEPAVATLVVRTLVPAGSLSPRAWLAAYLAVAVVDVVDVTVIAAAMSAQQGRLRGAELRGLYVAALFSGLLGTTMGLVVLLTVRHDLPAAGLLTVLGVTLAVAYRGYSELLRRHEGLGRLYTFTRSVRGVDEDAVGAVTAELRRILRCDTARLWLAEDGPAPDDLVADVAGTGRPRLLARTGADPRWRAWLAEQGHSEAMAVPLGGPDGVRGVVAVADRLAELATFTDHDLRLLETVAAHVESVLENARLVHRLRHDARHDALTGLVNRTHFLELIGTEAANGRPCAVVLMDLDRFKEVNDSLGHAAGDRLLVEVAARLAADAPAGAAVARLGGDEFAVLLPGTEGPAALAAAHRLHAVLERPARVVDIDIAAGASVGVALSPDHGRDAAGLLRRADIAMYAAKAAGLAVQVYSDGLDRGSARRLQLAGELREGIANGQLVLHYQPKVAVATGTLLGVEALVRWQHPEQGLVPPDEFVPIAEHTGLIGALTSVVLREALAQCRAWLTAGQRLQVSVNVSVRGLLDPTFPAEVAGALAASGVPAELLILEITENSVMADAERALPVLRRLHELGVSLSVDDFGTGYSSLAYLRRLPVAEVKIDKSFVLSLGLDENNAAIVRAIVELADSLGLLVVAEGVEDAGSFALLRDMGCAVAQGYLISRPLPAERFTAWLAANGTGLPGWLSTVPAPAREPLPAPPADRSGRRGTRLRAVP